MNNRIIILSIISILTFESCCKIKINSDEQLRISFVGYQFNEIDSFYIYSYTKNTNFQIQIDSLLIKSDSNYFSFFSDTALYFNGLGFCKKENSIDEDEYDYKIKNAFDNKEIFISKIFYEISSYKTGGGFKKEYRTYISNINSFTQNDTVHLNENVIYINK